ncbi:MAG: helix-hairpin-helix domain-containing protein [Bacteroidota bacterium]
MYFYFSPSERKGIIILLLLTILVVFIPSVYRLLKPLNNTYVSISKLNKLDSINVTNTANDQESILTNPININTASDDELKQLGLSEKNIATVHNYLSKGGKLKSIDDLKKLYGIKPDVMEQLTPFIVFTNDTNYTLDTYADSTIKKKTPFKAIELNTTDSATLVKLYRIGPIMAGRIIEYRNKLGGFLDLNQLMEIYGFDEDILYDLHGKIYVDASKAKKINLNTVSEEELKQHPYFKYKLARIIINYRLQHGNYKSYTDLLNIKIVNDSILTRIKIYGEIK